MRTPKFTTYSYWLVSIITCLPRQLDSGSSRCYVRCVFVWVSGRVYVLTTRSNSIPPATMSSQTSVSFSTRFLLFLHVQIHSVGCSSVCFISYVVYMSYFLFSLWWWSSMFVALYFWHPSCAFSFSNVSFPCCFMDSPCISPWISNHICGPDSKHDSAPECLCAA